MNDQDLIKQLNIEDFSEDDQEIILVEVEDVIGDRLFASMPEEKRNEFQEIVYDNIDHINWWLQENDPNYRESEYFQDIVEIVNEDGNPDNIRPEKVYATSRWIDINVPNYDEITTQVVEEFKDKNWAEHISKLNS